MRQVQPNKKFIIAGIAMFVVFAIVALIPLTYFDVPYSTVLLDRNNQLLSAKIAADGQWRFPPETNIPEKYRQAAITFEDQRFYLHPGIDPIAIMRALVTNIRQDKIVSGASTISMQVVRLSRPGKRRSITEKLIEMFLALHLEIRHDKDEILAMYTGHAPFGGNVVGLEAASWRYFGREPEILSWAEAALFAVLPNSPSLIHPGRNRDLLKNKRDRLLKKMWRKGILDSLTFVLATAENLPPHPHPIPMMAPHLLAKVQNQSNFMQAAKVFTTTVDKYLQEQVNSILLHHYQKVSKNGIHNAAAIVIDVDKNSILAYVGNIHNFGSGNTGNFVDIISSPRSTGSILKPFLYAGLMESGEMLPTQLVADIPTRMGGFAPQNYSRSYEGAVPAWRALARSLNIPAGRMLQSFGVNRFYQLLQNLGMTTLIRNAEDYGLSLILGGAEGSLLQISSIYAGMARKAQEGYSRFSDQTCADGKYPYFLVDHQISDADQNVEFPFSTGTCWLTLKAMLEVARPGTDNSWRNFTSSKKIAWKTGTSYGHRDSWAVGVTPKYVVGVWAGNADGEGRPGLTGLKVAAPILFEIINYVEDSDWFICPEADLHEVRVCAQSGFLAGINCAESYKIQVTQAAHNVKVCPYCITVNCDSSLTWQVNSDCESIGNIRQESWFVLPPVIEWYFKQKHPDYQPLPQFKPGCGNSTSSPLAVIYPQNNSTLYIPRELDGKIGRTVFTATHRNLQARLHWHLDDKYLGNTSNIHQFALAPDPGKHRLTIVDEDGNYAERVITVLQTIDQSSPTK